MTDMNGRADKIKERVRTALLLIVQGYFGDSDPFAITDFFTRLEIPDATDDEILTAFQAVNQECDGILSLTAIVERFIDPGNRPNETVEEAVRRAAEAGDPEAQALLRPVA